MNGEVTAGGAVESSVEARTPPLRRDRRVQAWVVTSGVSQAGDSAWLLGLAWTAAQVGGAHGAGLVIGIGTLPRALLTIFGGALADRLDARRTMVLSNFGRMLVLLAGIALISAMGVSITLLVVIAVTFGVIDALYRPAASTMPRQLVRPDDLGGVSAMFQLANRLAGFVGAPLGGILVAAGGLRLVMLADAVSFVAVSVILATVLKPRLPRPLSRGSSVRADIVDGLRYVRGSTSVRTLVVALSGLNLFVSPVLAVGVVLRAHEAGWSSTSLGLMEATIAVSAAIASAYAIAWRPQRAARTGLLLLVPQAIACMVVGVAPYAAMYVAMIVIGVTAGLASALLSGAFQRTVAPEYLGRAGGILSLGDDALMPVAMVAFGALAAGTSVAFGCLLMGVGFALLVTWSAARPALDPAT
jgi:MFS family permease